MRFEIFNGVKDRQTLLYFKQPYSKFKLDTSDIFYSQFLIQNVGYNDYFGETIQSYAYDNQIVQTQFLKLKKKLKRNPMFGLSLKDISLTIAY